MIDLKAARNDPDGYRAALARKGAAEAFDAVLEADERWRALVPRIDELRGKTKLKGKPSPEQLAEMQQVKEELRAAEEELAAAEAARDEALAKIPNPPHESSPDGTEEDDAVELSRSGEPPSLAEAREHTEIGRFDMERAARLSGSRFGYLIGDTALLALALYRAALDHLAQNGFTPVLPPVLVREEAMTGTGFFPTERSNIYALADDDLYLTGTSEVALAGLHMGEILDGRRAAAPLRRLLDELPPRGGRRRQGHARDVPRAPVQQGRDVRLHAARRSRGTSTSGCSSSRRSSCGSSSCRTGSSTSPRATSARPPRRSTTSRRGSRAQERYREIDVLLEHDRLPGATARDPLPRRAAAREPVHTLNGTMVTDRALLAILENFQGDVPDALREYGAPERVDALAGLRGHAGSCSLKRSCTAWTARSTSAAGTTHEIRTAEVEMIPMLIARLGERVEHVGRDARVRAHAGADERDLRDLRVVREPERADLGRERLEHLLGAPHRPTSAA